MKDKFEVGSKVCVPTQKTINNINCFYTLDDLKERCSEAFKLKYWTISKIDDGWNTASFLETNGYNWMFCDLKLFKDTRPFKRGDKVYVPITKSETNYSVEPFKRVKMHYPDKFNLKYWTIDCLTGGDSHAVFGECPEYVFPFEDLIHYEEDSCCNTIEMGENASVSVAFIKEAHAAACPDWKDKIEKQFPGLFPVITHKVGNQYDKDGNIYLLARVGVGDNKVALIYIKNGNLWTYSVDVRRTDAITEEEFDRIANYEQSKFKLLNSLE